MRVYPFKSLDGAEVLSASFVARGALQYDRAFAFFDSDDACINAKREPRVHRLRVTYDEALAAMFESEITGERCRFAFDESTAALAAFLARHFERPVTVRRDDDGGFPDDVTAAGPTIVSSATLATVASWFDGLTVEDIRLRLRTNIEVDGVPAFWEDRLFGAEGDVTPFRIGEVELGGMNPCARCIVPSRDARTGEPLPAFSKRVSERRAATLPGWADRSRFDHFYRLTVNTQAPGVCGRAVRVGDALSLAEEPRALR